MQFTVGTLNTRGCISVIEYFGKISFSVRQGLCGAVQFTLCKIDCFAAAVAFVFFPKLVGENLFYRTALGTVAGKRFEIFEGFESGAMLGCRHAVILSFLGVLPAGDQ